MKFKDKLISLTHTNQVQQAAVFMPMQSFSTFQGIFSSIMGNSAGQAVSVGAEEQGSLLGNELSTLRVGLNASVLTQGPNPKNDQSLPPPQKLVNLLSCSGVHVYSVLHIGSWPVYRADEAGDTHHNIHQFLQLDISLLEFPFNKVSAYNMSFSGMYISTWNFHISDLQLNS